MTGVTSHTGLHPQSDRRRGCTLDTRASPTGVPRLQENTLSEDLIVRSCVGPYGSPRDGGRFLMPEEPLYGLFPRHSCLAYFLRRAVFSFVDKVNTGVPHLHENATP